jgi:hypothetical protein
MSGVARGSLARSGLLLALLFGAFAIRMPTGQAACAAPQTSIDVERADPGQTLQVVGQAWGTECNDTGSCACGAGAQDPGRPRP